MSGPPASARRLQIADAAIELIALNGFGRLSHRAIDRRLEYPEGSTSYYFRRRLDIVGAVCRRIAEGVLADLRWAEAALAAPETAVDIDVMLRRLAETFTAWLLPENHARTSALLEIIQASTREPEINAIITEEWTAVTSFNRSFYALLGVGGDAQAMEPFRALLIGLMIRATVPGSPIKDATTFVPLLRDTLVFLAERGRSRQGSEAGQIAPQRIDDI